MYGVMIWVQNGLIIILTTLIIHSHTVGFENLETSGKKAISGTPIWTMRGAYGMHHHCHATSTYLSVAHLNMCHA
jgi:hypothetical protein